MRRKKTRVCTLATSIVQETGRPIKTQRSMHVPTHENKDHENNKHTSVSRECPDYVKTLELLKMETSTDLETKN